MLHGTVFGTVFYLAALIACVVNIYRFRKSHKPMSGFTWSVLSFLITISMGSVAAGLISPLHIPVNIYSMAVIYLLIAVLVGWWIRKEGMKQEYIWEKYDFIVLILTTIAVAAISLKIFSPQLWYCYYNSDAGLHLKEATAIVRSQKVTNMYFLHLQNAMFVEMIQPFVRIADWYKGYILGDCFFLWLETLFFAAMIRRFAKTKGSKVFAIFLMVCYFMGYPFFSYYYSFGYWAVGSMMVGFVAITLRLYEEAYVERKYSVFMLMLGCFGVMTSYMMFAPVTFVAAFVYLMIVAKREGKIFTVKNVLLALKVFLLPTVMGLYYCLYGFFISSGTSITGALGNAGGIYTELYMDFFWVIFPVLFMLAYTLKKRRFTPDVIFFLAFFGFTGVMLFLTLTHHVSTYYYYKTYYPLWMFCWVLTAKAASVMLQEAKETLIAYCALVAMFVVLCYGGVEYKIVTSTERITGAMHSTEFFTLYQYDWSFITRGHQGLDNSVFDLFQYVADNLSEEKMVPLMTEENDYGQTYLYEGVSGYDFPDFYEWRHTKKELKQAYYDWDVHYAVLMKGTQFEELHGKDVLGKKAVKILFENEAGYILELDYK